MKIGIWGKKNGGFTLFELVVTLTVLGIVALIVIPRLDPFTSGEMRRTARQLASLISHLTQESASTKEVYRLYFNLDSNDYWVMAVVGNGDIATLKEKWIKRRRLPQGVTFEDIFTAQKGRVLEGEVFMEFHPIGIEATTIHLQQEDTQQHWTLSANPLTGRVTITDRYVDIYEVS